MARTFKKNQEERKNRNPKMNKENKIKYRNKFEEDDEEDYNSNFSY
ncbi:MAG: hypothetical protein JXJ22_18445 [Bacteroidales bacterium]|nr:hypothetical protein [Bacteroidales bacterium]